MSSPAIKPHKTAISRGQLSRPVRMAVESGLISNETVVFDYGCGRGDDLRTLASLGVKARGWDPVYRLEGEPSPADVVNLGYVINVIPDPSERAHALRRAWDLARRLLIVSARLTHEQNGLKRKGYRDGCVTTRGTFQKFFNQAELRTWIDELLEESSVAAAPGIFFVFRDAGLREHFLSTRQRRRAAAPIQRVSDILFEEHREKLEEVMAFFADHGRVPTTSEVASGPDLVGSFGSTKQAFAVVRRVTEKSSWERLQEERKQDLLVYAALSRFGSRPRLSELPSILQADIRAHFGSYKKACSEGDQLLFSAGAIEELNRLCASSAVGKTTPDALYIYSEAISHLAPMLRVYEGCARNYVGHVDEANIVKLHRHKPQVSYLTYPKFERDPHPDLAESLVVSLDTLKIRWTDYRDRDNPPVLHRKETFVPDDHPLRERFSRLTRQEERHGLLDDAARIGTHMGWRTRLAEAGFRTRGHRLVRVKQAP